MCFGEASTCRIATIVAAVVLCVVGAPLLLAGAVYFSQGGQETERTKNIFLIGLVLLVVGSILLIVGVVLLMLICCTAVFDPDKLEDDIEEKERPTERPIIVHTTIVQEKHILRLSKRVQPSNSQETSENSQQTDIERNRQHKKHREHTFASSRSVNSTPGRFHDGSHRSQRLVVGTPRSEQGSTRPTTERSCHRMHPHREKPYYWDSRTAFYSIPHK